LLITLLGEVHPPMLVEVGDLPDDREVF